MAAAGYQFGEQPQEQKQKQNQRPKKQNTEATERKNIFIWGLEPQSPAQR